MGAAQSISSSSGGHVYLQGLQVASKAGLNGVLLMLCKCSSIANCRCVFAAYVDQASGIDQGDEVFGTLDLQQL